MAPGHVTGWVRGFPRETNETRHGRTAEQETPLSKYFPSQVLLHLKKTELLSDGILSAHAIPRIHLKNWTLDSISSSYSSIWVYSSLYTLERSI